MARCGREAGAPKRIVTFIKEIKVQERLALKRLRNLHEPLPDNYKIKFAAAKNIWRGKNGFSLLPCHYLNDVRDLSYCVRFQEVAPHVKSLQDDLAKLSQSQPVLKKPRWISISITSNSSTSTPAWDIDLSIEVIKVQAPDSVWKDG